MGMWVCKSGIKWRGCSWRSRFESHWLRNWMDSPRQRVETEERFEDEAPGTPIIRGQEHYTEKEPRKEQVGSYHD